MSWTRASAVAEIVSSVAVLATLAYLTVQTQQNTAAIISNSRQQALDSELQLLRMMVDEPVTALGAADAEGDDAIRQMAFDYAYFRTRETQWLQYRDGQLDEETMRTYLSNFVQNLRQNERTLKRWNDLKTGRKDGTPGLAPGFMREVDALLNEAQ